jgi:hypothetical protein
MTTERGRTPEWQPASAVMIGEHQKERILAMPRPRAAEITGQKAAGEL